MRLPVVEFHTLSVRLFAAVITVLSWRSQATMVTFSFVTLSSKGGGLYFLDANAHLKKRHCRKILLLEYFYYIKTSIFCSLSKGWLTSKKCFFFHFSINGENKDYPP